INLQKDVQPDSNQLDRWLIPLLSLIGIAIAGYMSYVEFYQVDAVCGPVGRCNTVQQSSYATLFGVIPIGFLGLLGYLTVIILWLVGIKDSPVWKKSADTALWIVTLVGTLFSIYLTFLEPFVIGATCIWCLTSAVLMTFLFLLATRRFKIS
ncbi:MAG: vitamin K epoxide reductase family protein, partial [Anaerolineales bacterium]|nr:vitamin K epoxide reductase family protein [Anaerolineales bacterium]